MRRTFAYGAATSQGRWPAQEDGFYADPAHGFFVLADGFGGRGNGDIAAKTALQPWRELASKPATAEGAGPLSPAQAWQRALFLEAHAKLLAWNEKRAPGAKGGCSLLAASMGRGRELAVTGCGSCAALLLRGGRWITLLSPQAAPRTSPEQALLPSQALGLGKDIYPETRSLACEPGDILFLFSSGLGWESPEFQAELLGQLALRLPGMDLGAVATLAVEGASGEGGAWNQTAIAVEALFS